MVKLKRSENWRALLVGWAATAVVLLVYAFGGLDWLELKTLDQRFRYASAIREGRDLVLIDIDDAALGLVGRWPWPRDVQAAVMHILGEAGVRALLVDITLVEPEPLRTITPHQADMALDPLRLDPAGLALAFPDHEIRTAIADLGQVYLATDYAKGDDYTRGDNWADFLDSDDFHNVLAALEQGAETEAADRSAALRVRPMRTRDPSWAPLTWARLVALLAADPALSGPQVAQRLGLSADDRLLTVLESFRNKALRHRVRIWLEADPDRWRRPALELYEALRTELFPATPRFDEPLKLALRHVLSYAATTRAVLVPPTAVAAASEPVDAVTPVYYLHARAARRCGFVVFEPDLDGITRRMRLLVSHRGRVLPQLAFAVACDALELGPEDITAEPGRVVLRRHGGAPPLVVQVDAAGRALVPWVPRADWTTQFAPHVPVAVVWQVFDRRQKNANNLTEVLGALAALPVENGLGDHAQYRDDLAQRLELEQRLRLARYAGDDELARQCAQWIGEYDQLLAEGEAALRAAVADEAARLTGAGAARSQPDQADYRAAVEHIAHSFAAIDEYKAEIDGLLGWLRKRVSGRIGLIGYTATALADMTPIPTHPRAPGVVAHANLLNGLLTGQTVSWAPRWLNMLPAALLGLLATAFSVRWGPRTAAIVALLIMAYVIFAGGVLFYMRSYWLAVTPTVGALVLSYMAVVIHRYVFLERERRQLATSLGQYTSATLARKMAEDPELCKRAETREVTAVFTDLAGFTTISERIGAERTQRVLNISLGRFSDVILGYEGMINKFIGDGIFAFWNPVIYPQADHAIRACETAVDLQRALAALSAEQRQAGGDEVFGDLVMRIGVATGSAVVGPCGSDKKYDYTCIGDSVNVAARLESANKFYGTRILISGATYEQTGDRFCVRSLGRVQVKGKTRGVPIYELLGRQGEVADDLVTYAARFGRAVELFRARQWAPALAEFAACATVRPADLAAQRYRDTVRQCQATPPPADWDGSLELTEK